MTNLSQISRRNMVSLLGTSAAGLVLAPSVAMNPRRALAHQPGFGPLSPQLPTNMAELPAQYQDIEFLSLPPGFRYSVISYTGEIMTDGNPVPGAHDGMAALKGEGDKIVLVRNHELTGTNGGVRVADGTTYDPQRGGGTTNLVLDSRGKLLEHYGSLAGTVRNCAGGPTPWNTWLTCEESFSEGDKRHGYVFEVPADGFADPTPIIEMGRYNHEAAAIDPATGYVYLTEDRGDSCLYRFRPNVYGDMQSGGVLEALVLTDWPEGVNTRTGFLGTRYMSLPTAWVTIDQPDPDTDTVRAEAQSKGAAIFSRGEGAWYGDGNIYFACSNGGDDGGGQIWAYEARWNKLMLIFEAERDTSNPDYSDNGGFLVAAPDNICVGPQGRLYLCEDGSGVEKVVALEANGGMFEFLRNNYNGSEFAGACFSPNGRIFFVNIQSPGLTFVVRGRF